MRTIVPQIQQPPTKQEQWEAILESTEEEKQIQISRSVRVLVGGAMMIALVLIAAILWRVLELLL